MRAPVVTSFPYFPKIFKIVQFQTFIPKFSMKPFRIAAHSPDGHGVLETLTLTEGAIVTSGNYERYVVIEGHRYSHIINPVTG